MQEKQGVLEKLVIREVQQMQEIIKEDSKMLVRQLNQLQSLCLTLKNWQLRILRIHLDCIILKTYN